jgi:hypothetical protein
MKKGSATNEQLLIVLVVAVFSFGQAAVGQEDAPPLLVIIIG